jgi:bifunctional DNA-binding transcriptional regulator/antitoxin component of YhaV-PrlF toxin-antitoxin module
MELRIDEAGRILVPGSLRERMGFMPNTDLEAVEQPDGVLLKRAERSSALVKLDGLWVHQGVAEPGADWDSVIESAREERTRSLFRE